MHLKEERMAMVEHEKDTGRATSDPKDRKKVLDSVKDQDVKFVPSW